MHGKRTVRLNDQRLPRPVRGRARELAALRDNLTGQGRTTISTLVKGAGGVGKTTLAKYFIHQYWRDYDGVLWCDAETHDGLVADLHRLYTHLRGDLAPQPYTQQQAQQLLDLIGQRSEKWLFVYDNVTSHAHIKDLMPPGDLIVTTRDSAGFAGFGKVDTERLRHDGPDSPAVQVLMEAAQTSDAPEQAQRLAAVLDGLPLALVVAGTLIHETRSSFGDYLEDVTRIINHLPPNSDYPTSVAGAVRLTYDRLGGDGQVLADLCAWLAPSGLTEGLFAGAVDTESWKEINRARTTPEVREVLEDRDRLRAGLAALRRWSVLTGADEMHRLTAAVLRAGQAQAGRDQAVAVSASALLAAQFPAKASPVDNWPICRALLPQVQGLWAASGALWAGIWDRPDWAAMDYLLNQAGLYLSKQKDLPGAIALKRAALDLTEARLGEDHRDVPLALGNLAIDLAATGALAEAQDKIDRAVTLDEAHRKGDARADLAARYMQQATIAIRRMEAGGDQAIGAAAQAEQALEKARALYTALFGETSAEMAIFWNQKGYFLSRLGRKAEEMQAFGRAVKITKALPAPDRGDLAARLMNLGSTALELGRAAEAETPLREAYGLMEERPDDFPDSHYLFKTTAGWLARCLLVRARQGQVGARGEAQALCARHGLDFAAIERRAEGMPLQPVTPEA